MYDNRYSDQRLTMLHRETDILNTFNRYWAALKNNEKIKSDLDVNRQISGLSYQLSRQPISAICNRSAFSYSFDQNVFPPRLQEQVARIGEAMGWNPATVLLATLAGVAMASSGIYQISVRPGWREPLALYAMIIAESGAGKSRLINMIKKPMNTVMDEKMAVYDQTAGRQAFISKEQLKAIRKTCSEGVKQSLQAESTREGCRDYNKIIQIAAEEAAAAHDAIEQVEKARPDSRPNFFLSNGTSKGILAALIQNHEYQAICEPEGGLIHKMVHDSGFDLDLPLKAYDGEAHQDVTSHGTASLKRPRLNILYGVQPGLAAKFFGCEKLIERGLTTRFLPIFPSFQERQNIDDAVLDEYDHIIQHILASSYEQNRNGAVRVLHLNEEAEYMVACFEGESGNWIADGFEHIKPFINKLRGTACRLAAALHLWLNYQNPEECPISAQTMACGIELAKSLLPHADYASNQYGLQGHAAAIRLLEWIKKYHKTQFELRSALQDTGLKKPQALPALDILDRNNVIRQIVTPGIAIPCVVNPNLDDHILNNIAAPRPRCTPDYFMNERRSYRSWNDRNYLL